MTRHRRQGSSPYRRRAMLREMRRTQARPDVEVGPMPVHRVPTGVELLALETVGLAVRDPGATARFLCDHLGLHELQRTPTRVVVGAGDGAATLTLVAADRTRGRGGFGRVVLRVADVARAVAALPAATPIDGDRFELAAFQGPEAIGLGFTLVAGGGIDYDVDHLVLAVSDPAEAWSSLARSGFVPRSRALHVADKYIALEGAPPHAGPPYVDHVAVRVESVEAVAATARERGLAVDEEVADGMLVVVLPGREQVRLQFVDQPPRR